MKIQILNIEKLCILTAIMALIKLVLNFCQWLYMIQLKTTKELTWRQS